MKIHEIRIQRSFDAPAAVVWEHFNDHVRLGQIMGQPMERIRNSSDPANLNGVDSIRIIRMPLFPFEETIRKSERARCIEYQVTRGTPLHHHYGTMLFADTGNGTSSIDYTIQLGSRFPLVGIVLKVALQQGITTGLNRLAAMISKK